MKSPSEPHRPLAQRVAVILAVIVQIGATALPQLGLGEPIGERSDSAITLITPAGWAFAIWGPLFFGSAVFAVWQALPAQRSNALLDRIAWPAAIAFAAQGAWAVYTQFANLTWVSVAIILASLAGLLVSLRELVAARSLTGQERWFAALVLSALAAWLTAASIVNIAAALVHHGIVGSDSGGGDYPGVTAGIVAVGGAIAALANYRTRGNPWFALVFCWALVAIFARGGQEATIIAVACAGAGLAVLAALMAGLSNPANRQHWLGV